MNFLEKILQHKKKEIEQKKKLYPLKSLTKKNFSSARNFKEAIRKRKKIKLIAEIKYKSPLKGILKKDFNHKQLAKIYYKSGANAISVLTDEEYFGGRIKFLCEIKELVPLPLLMKDFIIDEYQLYEAKYYGADSVLLIVSILKEKTKFFLKKAKELDIYTLTEVHNKEELEIALAAEAEIIGINNRNLNTFKTNLAITLELLNFFPKDKIIVSESGIKKRQDVFLLQKAGIDAILIGEALMKSKNTEAKIKELLGSNDQD